MSGYAIVASRKETHMAKVTWRIPDEQWEWLRRQAGLEQSETGEEVSMQDIVIRALEFEKARTERGGR